MTLSIIVAMSENGVIGRGNALPWHLPADLKRFKQLTIGHTLIMGRKTFQSIGRVLPGRKTIVVTRDPGVSAEGIEVASTVEEALQKAGGDPEIFVVGGGEIFGRMLELADRIYLTLVHAKVEGDTYFPDIDWSQQWREVSHEDHPADEKNAFPYSFRVYERRWRSLFDIRPK